MKVIKFWFVAQNKDREYLVGYLYVLPGVNEDLILDAAKEYCKEKKYRLVLLFQPAMFQTMVNQIYPFKVTDETAMCLDYALQVINETANA